NPSLLDALVSGAGYFIPSKVVTTIAEDQSPGMSQMILSFGLFTFGMSLLAMAYLLWQVPRRRDPAYSLIVVWAFVAIFMAITGARFIFDASPAFAVTAGFAIDQILVRSGQRVAVLFRGVRLQHPETDGLLSGRVAMVCDPGCEYTPGAPPRVPLVVGLRLRSRRPRSPPDRGGQLPGRRRARRPVHHG